MSLDPEVRANKNEQGRAQFVGDGVLVVDKPTGLTSHEVVQLVKRTFGAAKAGHSGTLDPSATGVLVVLINGATKLARFLTEREKTYRFKLYFGVETDTQDGTGEVVARLPCKPLQESKIKEACTAFIGEIVQTVPKYSAVRVDGQRLYRLARRGVEITPPSRKVEINELKFCGLNWPEATFEVTCSRGTYIRSLGVDLARHLDCNGHISQLRRMRSDGFDLKQAVTLKHLEEMVGEDELNQMLITPAEALTGYPAARVSHPDAKRIRQGGTLDSAQFLGPKPGQNWTAGPIKVLDPDDNLVAIVAKAAKAANDGQHREIIFKTLRVFGPVT